MRLARDLEAIQRLRRARRVALTIGAFDGLHLGHYALLDRVLDVARERDLKPVVMSFEPTPKEFFMGDNAPARLTRFRERFVLLREAGIELFYCPRFDRTMADIAVQDFIEQHLVGGLDVAHLVIGDDFRFGQRAAGSVVDLKQAGGKFDFTVEQMGSVVVAGERASSTRIRGALASGDLELTRTLLGREYRLSGRVIYGQQLGRTLGYPTANIALGRRISPVSGIFAVRIAGIDPSRLLDGVASIGTRPTVNGVGVLLEVHVFDFAGSLYGKRLEVTLHRRLRDELKFDSLEALTEQMHCDAADARSALAAGTLPK